MKPKQSNYRRLKRHLNYTCDLPSFQKREKRGVVLVVEERAVFHLTRQNETKRKKRGKKIKKVDVELTCLWLLSVRVAPGPAVRGKSSVMALPPVPPLKDTDQTRPSHEPSQPLALYWLTSERLCRRSVLPYHSLTPSCSSMAFSRLLFPSFIQRHTSN